MNSSCPAPRRRTSLVAEASAVTPLPSRFTFMMLPRCTFVGAGLLMNTFCSHPRDTVESVGVIMTKSLPFVSTNGAIKVFRHALSLDEVCTLFPSGAISIWQRALRTLCYLQTCLPQPLAYCRTILVITSCLYNSSIPFSIARSFVPACITALSPPYLPVRRPTRSPVLRRKNTNVRSLMLDSGAVPGSRGIRSATRNVFCNSKRPIQIKQTRIQAARSSRTL